MAAANFKSFVEEFSAAGGRKVQLENRQGKEGNWRPPTNGAVAIHVDVSIRGSLSAAAMVVRNSEGRLVFFASHWGEDTDPAKAELEALGWAARLANEHGWRFVDWRSDAQAVVNELLSLEDPSRYEILSSLQLFYLNPDWLLHWVPREENSCADIAAKWARNVKCNIVLFDHFADNLRLSVWNCVAEDRTSRSLLL